MDARRHDLDALRSFAMLLGLVLHGALSFFENPWVVQDGSRAPQLGFVVAAIHGFRMPLFFLLSGFFAAMLWRRRGLRGLLQHRAKRVALPLLLGCMTIVPVMWVVVTWAGRGNDATYDTGRDVWTAAALGDLEAVRGHLARGASFDGDDPTFGQSPLGWAVVGDRREVIAYLLGAGADPSARYRDRNTALHTAAFFGRAEAAALLLEAGADVHARNERGEAPLDVLRHGRGSTEFVAGVLKLPIDFDAVQAGRARVREMLESRGAGAQPVSPGDGPPGALRDAVLALMVFPFFHHLWFLWFLCWLVAGFALVAALSGRLPRVAVPRALVGSPLCLLWLVPLSLVPQFFMQAHGAAPGFGPDNSAGLLPMPHVLAYYAIFFGFGALVHESPGAADRLGRGWWLQLSLALLLLLPLTLAWGFHTPWGLALAGDEATRRLLSNLGQVLYAWLMIFGLMGLFEATLGSERPLVRYVSDSSYWLYLAHLPLVIVGQALLRRVEGPALVEFGLLLAVVTLVLLVSYEHLVRYRWLGRLLNGPRTRAPALAESARGSA